MLYYFQFYDLQFASSLMRPDLHLVLFPLKNDFLFSLTLLGIGFLSLVFNLLSGNFTLFLLILLASAEQC